ncbi:hypothetical protein BJB45_11575 [Halomonas huangheensis]|uniref:Uncharacterized protein n=1 Tax=Halomonas huangheensis TaxID=1178482 RepID=W1N8F3_9GAMM|nr:hypothetical protein BJB45_11575 [Halomonas huangheensis]
MESVVAVFKLMTPMPSPVPLRTGLGSSLSGRGVVIAMSRWVPMAMADDHAFE